MSPFAGERGVSMLMRFAYTEGDGKNLVEHYGHRLRHEIIEYWKADPLEGSEQGLKSPQVAHHCMCELELCIMQLPCQAARVQNVLPAHATHIL